VVGNRQRNAGFQKQLNQFEGIAKPSAQFEKAALDTSQEPLDPAKGKSQPRKNPMDMTEAISVSGMLDQQPNNGNGHIHTLNPHQDSYQSGYDAGMTVGKEEGYRRGYREGFSDGFKLGNPTHGAASIPDASKGASKKTVADRASRLRGLPCANCGCSSYSDEVQCPGCGTPKVRAVGEQSTAAEELRSLAKMLSGDKTR
jgi:hypothetical protein